MKRIHLAAAAGIAATALALTACGSAGSSGTVPWPSTDGPRLSPGPAPWPPPSPLL